MEIANLRQQKSALVLGTIAFLLSSTATLAQTRDDGAVAEQTDDKKHSGLLLDIEAYYTAPLHWDARDWAYFGGAVAAVAAAHHYDTQVRTHFTKGSTTALTTTNTDDLQDALPAIAAVGATWLYANMIDSNDGRKEVWEMLESSSLSSITSFGLKYAAGRERPNQTADPNKWRAGGSSFPSIHVSAAAAIGTVLAESGNDEYRWARRFLGYGLMGFTGYERLKHNDHWLSDTFAGAALGASTAHFVMNRRNRATADSASSSLSVVPVQGGAMLTYNLVLP
jgi:membrane-associated phospholipid phosphatase